MFLIWNITLPAVWAAFAPSGRQGSMRDILSGKKRKRKQSIELTWKQRWVCAPFSWEFLTQMEAKWSELKAEARVQVCAGCFSMHGVFFFVADVQEYGVFGSEQQWGQASTNFLIFRLRIVQPFCWRFPLTFDPGAGLSWPRGIPFELQLSVKEQSWGGRRRKPRGCIWRAHGCGRLRRSLLTLTGWRH